MSNNPPLPKARIRYGVFLVEKQNTALSLIRNTVHSKKKECEIDIQHLIERDADNKRHNLYTILPVYD